MTLHDWLTVTLSGLAPEVAARLRAEYLGHAQDMLEGGEPVEAVLRALGDPARLNAELRERYLTEYEAKVLAARSRAWSARAVRVPLLMGVLRDVTGDYRAGFAVVALGYLLALGVVLLLRRHVGRRGVDA